MHHSGRGERGDSGDGDDDAFTRLLANPAAFATRFAALDDELAAAHATAADYDRLAELLERLGGAARAQGAPEGTPAMVSLGPLAFAPGVLRTQDDRVTVMLGMGYFAEVSIAQARELTERRREVVTQSIEHHSATAVQMRDALASPMRMIAGSEEFVPGGVFEIHEPLDGGAGSGSGGGGREQQQQQLVEALLPGTRQSVPYTAAEIASLDALMERCLLAEERDEDIDDAGRATTTAAAPAAAHAASSSASASVPVAVAKAAAPAPARASSAVLPDRVFSGQVTERARAVERLPAASAASAASVAGSAEPPKRVSRFRQQQQQQQAQAPHGPPS